MKTLLSTLRWPHLLILALSTGALMAHAQAESGDEAAVNSASSGVIIYRDERPSQVIRSDAPEHEVITLSNPELEARIRAVGSQALREQHSPNPDGSIVVPRTYDFDSPEYRLAVQVDRQLRKELASKRDNLPPLERMAVYDEMGVVEWEELAPYRFADTTSLFEMLRDPYWANFWGSIAITIARVADEESALKLIDFIKDPELPREHINKAKNARQMAIRSLPLILKDQEVPEVTAFIERLTDANYAQSLGSIHAKSARSNSLYALAAIGDTKSVNILESLYQEAQARRQSLELQPQHANQEAQKAADQELRLIEGHLNRARSKQLGVPGTLDDTRDSRYSR